MSLLGAIQTAAGMTAEQIGKILHTLGQIKADVAKQRDFETGLIGHPIEDAEQAELLAEANRLQAIYELELKRKEQHG